MNRSFQASLWLLLLASLIGLAACSSPAAPPSKVAAPTDPSSVSPVTSRSALAHPASSVVVISGNGNRVVVPGRGQSSVQVVSGDGNVVVSGN